MATCLLLLIISLIYSAHVVLGDSSLLVDTDYYISSMASSYFISNLVIYTDGTSTLPNVWKDSNEFPIWARWYITNVPGSSNTYQLRNRVDMVLDITGGGADKPDNPKLFLNNVKDTSLDGQTGWVFAPATESNLYNAQNGFWAAIVNRNWNLALRVPRMAAGVNTQVVLLEKPPTTWDVEKYFFFASVTRGTVWQTATVTSRTTITEVAVTQTINAAGPTSTITSTVIQTLTTTAQVTSTKETFVRRGIIAPRFVFTTVTSTTTRTVWQTSTVDSQIIKVTKQGGYVYVTDFVTSNLYITATSTVIVTNTVKTSVPTDESKLTAESKFTAESKSTAEPKSSTGAAPSATPTSTSSSIRATDIPPSPNSTNDPSSPDPQPTTIAAPANSKGTPVTAIVGGVLGSALVFAIIAGWFYRRHRQAHQAPAPAHDPDDNLPEYRGRSEMDSSVPGNAIPNPRNSEMRFWNGLGFGAVGVKIGELPSATPVVRTAELGAETQTAPRDMASFGMPERQEMSGIGANMVGGPEPQFYHEIPAAHQGSLPYDKR